MISGASAFRMKVTLAMALMLPVLLTAVEAGKCPLALDVCVAEKSRLFAKRGVLGILFHRNEHGEPEAGNYVVQAAPPDYPAGAAGMKEGDVLLSINGTDLAGVTWLAFEAMLEKITVGDAVTFRARRGQDEKTFRLVAAPGPPTSVNTWIGQHVRDHHPEKEYREYLRRLQAAHPRPPAAAPPPKTP